MPLARSPTSRDAYHAFRARKTFSNLDGLRALSIFVVLWHHTMGQVPYLPGTGRGFLGVDMFFALSGFLIVTLSPLTVGVAYSTGAASTYLPSQISSPTRITPEQPSDGGASSGGAWYASHQKSWFRRYAR